MNCILQMWKRGLDFKGKSTRKEFICPFAVNTALAIEVLFTVLTVPDFVIFWYIALFGTVYLILSVLPMAALTVRRLRDTGKGAAWFLLLFLPVIGEVILAVVLLGGTLDFSPVSNEPYSVYGPPVDYSVEGDVTTTEKEFRPEDNTMPAVYGPPEDYFPEDNIEATVYGPPVSETMKEFITEDESAEEEYIAEENIPSDVSDPKPDEFAVTTAAQILPVPEETFFDPEDNLPPVVYGPPVFFE